MNSSPRVIMITGAAGYVGAMLCDQFSKSPDLVSIVAVDKRSMPEILKNNKKIIWLTANLHQNIWKIPALINKPEVIIHCAWQDGELYGQEDLQRQLNIKSTKNLMEFALTSPFVKKIVFFSSANCYGAMPENDSGKYFNENDSLHESEYLYGREKIEAEAIVEDLYEASDKSKGVYVLRSAYIIGPRRHHVAGKKDLVGMLINIFPVVPNTSLHFSLQCVHEDDLIDLVGIITFTVVAPPNSFHVFNISAPGLIYCKDVAETFNKSITSLPPILVRAICFILWTFSSGKIQTPFGFWRYLCFPVLVDSSKMASQYDFDYVYTARQALDGKVGRYASCDKDDSLNVGVQKQ